MHPNVHETYIILDEIYIIHTLIGYDLLIYRFNFSFLKYFQQGYIIDEQTKKKRCTSFEEQRSF